jgi:hypothetical protein
MRDIRAVMRSAGSVRMIMKLRSCRLRALEAPVDNMFCGAQVIPLWASLCRRQYAGWRQVLRANGGRRLGGRR